MHKTLMAGIVSGVLTAIFMGSPAGVLGQGLTVSGYADFEAVVNNVNADDTDFYFDNHHFNIIMMGSIVDDLFAAVAYDPKPTDFTDSVFATSRILEQLVAAITNGKNAMPPFAGTISLDEIRALAGYLLELGEVSR